MKLCSVCNTYNSNGAEYCEYCGEIFYREYAMLSEVLNIFHARKYPNKKETFPFYKNRQLCLKIDQEIRRVQDIELLSHLIGAEDVVSKIALIIESLKGYIDSLIKCRIDIEYIRVLSALSSMKKDSKGIDAQSLVAYCAELKESFVNAFTAIKETYDHQGLDDYVLEKRIDLDRMIENVSIVAISSILSNASIVRESAVEFQTEYKALEENIDRINYEIDRLSAELSV